MFVIMVSQPVVEMGALWMNESWIIKQYIREILEYFPEIINKQAMMANRTARFTKRGDVIKLKIETEIPPVISWNPIADMLDGEMPS
ncbi:MAG: hypothetical protein CMO46_02265 [Verrucomicrobiales bacterium]|nr:hypothetical protein [Verrucomicrobiales bacterium]|tara:strand:+ start:3002 stop:3262 length:261 start_codon:yes stop_codon:yes gene_type:complete